MPEHLNDKQISLGMVVRYNRQYDSCLVYIVKVEDCISCKRNHYYSKHVGTIHADRNYHPSTGELYKANTIIK